MKLTFNDQQILIIKRIMRPGRTFTDRGDVLEFVTELHDAGLVFHFDDNINQIMNFVDTFDEEELDRFQANTDRMRITADRLNICPFDFSLRLSGHDDPHSFYYNKKPITFETDSVKAGQIYYHWIVAHFDLNAHRDMILDEANSLGIGPQCDVETLAFEQAVEDALAHFGRRFEDKQ